MTSGHRYREKARVLESGLLTAKQVFENFSEFRRCMKFLLVDRSVLLSRFVRFTLDARRNV